jgi:hypothetical protein
MKKIGAHQHNGFATPRSYFNPDVKGTYKVVIEGIDLNLHLG